MSGHSIAAYRNKLRTTQNRVLLVEGPDDKRLFKRLIDEYLVRNPKPGLNVVIDTATTIKSPDDRNPLGNRDKVLAVCAGITDPSVGERFVGFVDREFQWFSGPDAELVEDHQPSHFSNGCVMFSRGHSVENYYFDFDTLRNPLRTFSVTDTFDLALDLFSSVFDHVMRVACSISLAGRDVGYTTAVVGSIDWELLTVTPTDVVLNIDEWKTVLVRRLKLQPEIARELADRYVYWLRRVMKSSAPAVRWMCHGHIGLATLWASYASCVYNVTGSDRKETVRVLKAEESVRFNACAEEWVGRVLRAEVEFPEEVLKKLGVTAS